MQETQTGHSSQYNIIGESHTLALGGTLYTTNWYLEPVATTQLNPWKLDDTTYSKLDATTKLVY